MKTIEQIGRNAGIVWRALSTQVCPVTFDYLIEKTELEVEDFYTALGWLARENKLFYTYGDDEETLVSLIPINLFI